MAYQSVWGKIIPKGRRPVSQVQQSEIKKILPQTGKVIDAKRDAARPAKLPGVRISKTGKKYWESRTNRTDAPMKNI